MGGAAATHRRRAFMVALASAGLVFGGTVYFASRRPEYRHVTHTISELGESGSPHAAVVGFGIFLPAGLLAWAALLLAYGRSRRDRLLTAGLLAFACLGLGYVGAAFFPCDPGSPLVGTWRQQVHNAFGFVEYLGAGLGLLLLGWHARRRGRHEAALALAISGGAVLSCLALLSMPPVFPIRGGVQRVAEVVMFAWLCLLAVRGPADIILTPDSGRGTASTEVRR